MEFNNTKHNPRFKKSTKKEGIVCFKIREARGTGWLSFNDMKLLKVPSEIYNRLPQLHHLYLSRCQISGALPVELGYLSKLQVLDVSLNKINSVPDNLLANLTELEILDLSGNKLTSLPYTVEYLKKLKELSVAQNQLVAVPHTLGRLRNLLMLDFSHNMIKFLQPEMFQGGIGMNLQILQLSNNLLDRLPHDIAQLQKLKELDVSDNKLYFLPTSARLLRNLQTIRFSGNKWTNPAPRYYDKYKTEEQLNSSYGIKAHSKVCSLVYPAVM